MIPNAPDNVRRLVRKLGTPDRLHLCYEAGPCGYHLYWQLTALGIRCDVVAPTLVPTKAGDRVKTDRRDAEKLARFLRSGDLTPVWVPDAAHEALRDLVRAREAAKRDERRARHRLQKLLLRHGHPTPEGIRNWSERYRQWAWAIRLEHAPLNEARDDFAAEVEHQRNRIVRLEAAIDNAVTNAAPAMRDLVEALQALRGVSKHTATVIATELGDIARFEHPRQLMGYSGLIPKEHSSGGPGKASRGAITKTGNAHLRRVLTEAAWAYRYRPRLVGKVRRRQEGLPSIVQDIGWKAQLRLHERYVRMVGRGKCKQKVITALARELLAFVWAIGREVRVPGSGGCRSGPASPIRLRLASKTAA